MEGGGLQDFLCHQGDDNDNNDGLGGNVIGPEIAVGGAVLIARAGDAPSTAASSMCCISWGTVSPYATYS